MTTSVELPVMSKSEAADRILDAIVKLIQLTGFRLQYERGSAQELAKTFIAETKKQLEHLRVLGVEGIHVTAVPRSKASGCAAT